MVTGGVDYHRTLTMQCCCEGTPTSVYLPRISATKTGSGTVNVDTVVNRRRQRRKRHGSGSLDYVHSRHPAVACRESVSDHNPKYETIKRMPGTVDNSTDRTLRACRSCHTWD